MRVRGLVPVAMALAIMGAMAARSPGARAQSYPDRAIKLVVPFTPGSPVDAAARILAHHLQGRLGQSVVIESRAGGGTTIGTRAAATATPDGYTLLVSGTTLAFVPVLFPSFDAELIRSLVPVAPLVSWSHVIVAGIGVPVGSLAELAAYAKAHPRALVFGFGQGTTPQVLGTSLVNAAGIELTMLSYRGGDEARNDLLGGRVHLNVAPIASLLGLIQDSRARPLAYTGARRSADLPDVPTTRESGFPTVGYHPDVWVGLMAPAGTPDAVITRLHTAAVESLASPAALSSIAKLGYEPMQMTQAELAAFIAAERLKWPPLLAAAGIRAP